MGYHRPVSQWNHGKKSEYAERKEYIPPTINNKTELVSQKKVEAVEKAGKGKYQELASLSVSKK
jgi:hypothetical protein